jgi:peptidoglycan/LPS O-acetylase OafA/YrhL
MAAIARWQRSTPTWLTGAAGSVLLLAALVMMVAAAPSRPHPLPHRAAATYTVPAMELVSSQRHVVPEKTPAVRPGTPRR